MAKTAKPLNYTPVPPRDTVSDIILAAEDAKLAKRAKHLAAGGAEAQGIPDERPDWVGGLQPEEWLTGLKGFYTGVRDAQRNKPEGTRLSEDIARGVVANTIGNVVPPLRQRALEGMSPAAQVTAEIINPVNWPGGGAEAGIPLSFFMTKFKPNKVGMGTGVIKDIHRGIIRGPTKGIRLSPVEGGEFRPLHAGTEYTAIDRVHKLGGGTLSEHRTPTITKMDLPVRDTLGTFDLPLEDPGSHWVKDQAIRDALQQRGIDAIIYRNSVEGHGEISLEALSEFKNPETRALAARSASELGAMSREAAEAPYQMLLPAEEFKQSTNLSRYDTPLLSASQAAQKLGLERGNLPGGQAYQWSNVWDSLAGGRPHAPPKGGSVLDNQVVSPKSPAGAYSKVVEEAESLLGPPIKSYALPGLSSSGPTSGFHQYFDKLGAFSWGLPNEQLGQLLGRFTRAKFTIDDIHTVMKGKDATESLSFFLNKIPLPDDGGRTAALKWADSVAPGKRYETIETVMQLLEKIPPKGEGISAGSGAIRSIIQAKAVQYKDTIRGMDPYSFAWREFIAKSAAKSAPFPSRARYKRYEALLRKYDIE